jgi:hypothetical protein
MVVVCPAGWCLVRRFDVQEGLLMYTNGGSATCSRAANILELRLEMRLYIFNKQLSMCVCVCVCVCVSE